MRTGGSARYVSATMSGPLARTAVGMTSSVGGRWAGDLTL